METPSKNSSVSEKSIIIDETTINEINGKQLDIIATNVNRTIQDLNVICRDIGYSSTEISIKKAEIFQVLELTINNFTQGLIRDKQTINNECEWLRQQIKIILSIINDHNGVGNLVDMNRGIVFQDWEIYQKGYKIEIEKKINTLKTKRDDFYEDSPFNISNNQHTNEINMLERSYEKLMMENVPSLSLLQTKQKLNSIFLDVLKIFIKSFKKFNTLNLKLHDVLETIGMNQDEDDFLKTLPNKLDSEHHKELILVFENIIKNLRLSDSTSGFGLRDNSQDNISFIISSPLKNRQLATTNNDLDINNLRDVNYKIVTVIRSLRFTKIDNQLLSNMNKFIKDNEIIINERVTHMNSTINQCFELIEILGYNEQQLINIQKLYRDDNSEDSGYFDYETLKFIQLNPKEFGLNQAHLNFMDNFLNLLIKIKTSKQRKWSYYYENVNKLWIKLGENSDYTENFINSNSNLTDSSIINFKMELNRLMIKRTEFIDTFILDTRKEIEKMWADLYYTDESRQQFKYFEVDGIDDSEKESVLNDHEELLSSLKAEFELKQPILKDYEDLKHLLDDQKFLIESSKDSSRLLSKNSCKILLNEERIRKKILKTMPKLLTTLKNKVIEYNNKQLSENGRPFMIFHEDLFEKLLIIENQQSRSSSNSSTNSSRTIKKKSPVKKPIKVLNHVPVKRQIKSINNSRKLVSALENSSPFKDNHTLKPLNSPLVFNSSPNKISPLRYNFLSPSQTNNSIQSPTLTLPVSQVSSQLTQSSQPPRLDDDDDKENFNNTFNLDLGLTPIKINDLKWDKNTSTPASEKSERARDSINSSNIMTEYQLWRDQRLNNRH